MDWNKLKAYLLARLTESSTWRGLVLIVTALGGALTPDQREAVVLIGLAVAGAIAAAVPDKQA